MADKTSSLDQIKILSADELTAAGVKLAGQPSLAQELERNALEAERSPVKDTAVGIFDTLQSISTTVLSPLPGIGLADIGRMSSELDQFRSPGYLAERAKDAQRVADVTQAEGEWAGFKEGVATTLEGGNLAPDALAQIPYLALGPVARAMGSGAAMAVPGVLGRATAAIGGTSNAAIANRIAALSGVLEGAGGYSQTYERAIADGLSPEEADAQAQKAGLAAAIAGTVLGKLTPGFEMDPLGIKRGGPAGQFLGDILAPSLSNVAGEITEEVGIAVTNTVADNVLAGKDPLEGVGGASGQAAALAGVFSGGMQSPGLVKDASLAIGKGVVQGLQALAGGVRDRAVTPEGAATDAAANVVADANAIEGEVIQSTEAGTDTVQPGTVAGETSIAETPSTEDNVREELILEMTPSEVDAPPLLKPNRPRSNSRAVENVLLNAQMELAIESTTDEADQARLLAAQEEFAPDVEEATQAVENLTDDAIQARVEATDEQSQLVVEAVRLTDVSRLPDEVLSEDEQAIAQTIRELKDTKVDRTAEQIFESGFAGKVGSRGIRGFLQSILNYGRMIGDKPNEGSQNLTRFVGVLEERAALFQDALDKMARGEGIQKDSRGFPYIDVVGSKTLDEDGKLTDKPFRIWVNLPNSVDTANRVIADAARARGALENARKRFPGMFPTARKPETANEQGNAEAQADARASEAGVARESAPEESAGVPDSRTDSNATQESVQESAEEVDGLSLEKEVPVDRTAPDLDANARKEEGLYPDQPKNPNSTRIEDEKGLIDIDMTGEVWIGTNNWSNPKKAEKGDGLERLKTALRMAKAAGKKYNSDQSLSGSALGMYLKALDAGIITATLAVPRERLNDALKGRNGFQTTKSETISAENSVFKDVQLVEQSTDLGENQEAGINALLDLIEAEEASRQQELDLQEGTEPAPVATEAPTTTANVVSLDAKRKAAGKERPLIDQVVSVIQQLFPNAKLLDLEALDAFLEKESGASTVDALAAYLEKQTPIIVQNLEGIATAVTAGVSTAFLNKQREKALEVLKFMPSDLQNGFLNFWTSLAEGASYMEAFNALPDTTDGFVLATLATSDQYNRELDDAQQKRISKPVAAETPAPTVAEEASDSQADEGWFERERLWSEEDVQEDVAPREEAVAEEAPVNPLVVAPLQEGQSWVGSFIDAFRIDPAKSIQSVLDKLTEADRTRIMDTVNGPNGVLAKLKELVNADLNKKGINKPERLKMLLERPYGVFMHGVIKNADGTYEMHPALLEAFAYAAVMQAYRAPTLYDESTLKDEETGEIIRAAQPHAWSREIARDAALFLGLKPNKKESVGLTQGLMLSLGLSATQALVNGGDAETSSVPTGAVGTNGKPLYMTVLLTPEKVRNVVTKSEDFLDNVSKALGSPREYTATLSPSDNVPEHVNYSGTKTSDSQKTALRNRQSVPHYLNPVMMDLLELIGQSGINRLLTGAFKVKGMPKAVVDYLDAKEAGIRSEIRAINFYQKLLDTFGDRAAALYWQYGINVNSRSDSRYSPQSHTLIRDLFTSAKDTINLKNDAQLTALKFAIAQAVGIKTDQTVGDVLKQLDAYIAANGEKTKQLVQAIANKEKVFPFLERGTPYKPRELAGLLTLGQMLMAQEAEAANSTDGPLKLTTYLSFEVDGKTNGAFNAELFYGLGNEIHAVNLEQGGLFLDTTKATWGEKISEIVKKYEFKDLYLRVAAKATPIMEAKIAERLKKAQELNPKEKARREELINQQRQLMIATDMLNAEGTAFLREAAKRASNPTVYGAGIKGVASQLIADMKMNLVNKWVALDYQLKKDPNNAELKKQQKELEILMNQSEETFFWTAYTAADALLTAYKREKPNVTRVTEVMVQITTLGFAIKRAQWVAQHKEELKKFVRNENIPDTEKRNGKEVEPAKWPLPMKAYERILRNTLSMRFSTAANPEAVNLDDADTASTDFPVEGLGTTFSATLDLPQPKVPGVRALALLTIGAGDAAMVNEFLQVFRAITDVYDGIEFKPTDALEGSVALNEAAWKVAQHDVLKDFESLADQMLKIVNEADPEMTKLILEAYNANTVSEAQQISSFYPEQDVETSVPSFFEQVQDAKYRITRERKAHQEGLAQLKSKPNVMLQMAYGDGYVTPVEARDAAATTPIRTGWNDAVATMFEAVGNKANRQLVQAMLDSMPLNRIQRMVWKRLRNFLPDGLSITLARNAQEWEEATGKNDYGKAMGRTFIDGNRIVLATTNPTIILHEVMHATLSKLISNYTINPALVPVEARTAVNNLVQLLNTFRAMKDPRLEAIQNELWKLQDVWGDTAAAVDEMMTWVLTDPTTMRAVEPGFFSRMILRIKQVFWSFLGKEVPGTFLDDVISSFTKLTNDLVTNDMTDYGDSGMTRDAVNTLDALTQRAYIAMGKRAKKDPNFRVGKTLSDSMRTAVETKYSLTADQKMMYDRVFTILRLNARKGELEQFVSTALPKHPNAGLFSGAKDLTASVLALAAVESVFAGQLESLYFQERGEQSLVDNLLDKVLDDNQHLRVEEMLSETLNAIIADSEYQLSYLGLATQRADRLGSDMLNRVGEKAYEIAQESPRGVSDLMAGIYALTTENGAEAFGRRLLDAVNAHTNHRWLQDLMGALVGSQVDTNAVYRQVKRFKNVVAQTRSDFTIILPKVLKTLFPADFDGWNTLYEHFARLDVAVLGAEASTMFKNDQARSRIIKALESKVKNHWDAKNLAHYMVHGTVDPNTPHALLRNARAIADNVNGTAVKASDELVADVDQLVTLYAIEALKPFERARMVRYFDAYPQAMNNLIGMLQKIKVEEDKQYRDQYRYNYWKGEMPLTVDPRHSIVVAGKIQGAKLEQLGYTKGDKYKNSPDDPATDLHYYTRPYAPPPVFAQGILATVQQTSMGINYTTAATITPEVGTMITNRRLVDYIKRNQGKGSNLVPIFNFQGEVVGYERLLDRQKVRDYTGSNNTLLHISIGKKLGRILEERWANTFNRQAIQILVNQWEDGKARGTQNQYEAVNSTTDKQVARAWEVIPGPIKQMLEEAFDGPVMIRRDLIQNTLGYHNAGVGDVFTGNASLNEETRKFMIGLAQTIFMGPRAAQILYAAEAAIKEGVATARDWIIVRSMSVAYNNFMASINLVVANGVPLKQIIKHYRQGMQDVRVYSRLKQEEMELKVKAVAATGAERAKLETLAASKHAAMKRLSIYPLIEAGELSDLPEGLIESPDNSYLGDFTGWMNKHLVKIHPKMPTVVANVAIAKDSQFHDTLSKAIQAGDFLARYAVYQHLVQTGMKPEDAADRIRDEFVAYAMNPGRARAYAEAMGMVHWSQFTIRAQKVLLTRLRQNPFSFFVSQMGANVAGTDGPLSMSLTERGFDNSTGLDQTVSAPTAHIYAKLM